MDLNKLELNILIETLKLKLLVLDRNNFRETKKYYDIESIIEKLQQELDEDY